MVKIAISCVVDDNPELFMQCWNWLCSLRHLGSQERADIFIHYVEGIDRARLSLFEDLGAKLVPIAPFGPGPARYCNKIRQLENAALRNYEHVVLCDTDLAFLECPTYLASGSAVRGKPVDLDNPPQAIWSRLFTDSGLGVPPVSRPLELTPQVTTFATNFNGGLYVIPGAVVERLADLWAKWARFCLARSEILGKYAVHSDQIGFGMALLDGKIAFDTLPLDTNFPLHQRRFLAGLEQRRLKAIHYHRVIDDHGLLATVGVPWVDRQVRELNENLKSERRLRFDNAIFWDFRYSKNPELGSGIGSRGQVLAYKRRLLLPYFRAFADGKILDVGCGDFETTRYMPARNYHGIDVAATAIETSRMKRPDWRFDMTKPEELAAGSYDLAVCMDVLLHQGGAVQVEDIVNELVRLADRAVIVSGYSAPVDPQGIVFFSRPLEDMLSEHPSVAHVEKLGSYRDVDVFLAVKHGAMSANRHDIALPGLAWGMAETPDWELLSELVGLSRTKLGFFPSTIIRTIEYPWFAQRLDRHAGDAVLDVGAGVCVLPLWLAGKGCKVVTVDNHPLVRDTQQKSRWNEWGFLDYSSIDPAITSLQVDASTFEASQPFGAIYSVSVLEHVPGDLRRAILANLKRLLADHGYLYLSFDLVPNTNDLWPLSEGKTVETPDVHGRLVDVQAELRDAGFQVLEATTRRHMEGSRTDLAFIVARHAQSKGSAA
jgi:2-polyprenyl-3-methyl-5-hydroxy-6-metoxy-1,4-benzoquinol methylase